MKSIQRKFNSIQELNPYWSSFSCFVETVKPSRYSRDKIMRYFNKLVDKEDYSQSDKAKIYSWLIPPK